MAINFCKKLLKQSLFLISVMAPIYPGTASADTPERPLTVPPVTVQLQSPPIEVKGQKSGIPLQVPQVATHETTPWPICTSAPIYEVDYYLGCAVSIHGSFVFFEPSELSAEYCDRYCQIRYKIWAATP